MKNSNFLIEFANYVIIKKFNKIFIKSTNIIIKYVQ